MHRAARSELLSARAVVDVACRIISKVAGREGAIISLGLVDHRDMWRDTLLLDLADISALADVRFARHARVRSRERLPAAQLDAVERVTSLHTQVRCEMRHIRG
jgi:hypothetical protein